MGCLQSSSRTGVEKAREIFSARARLQPVRVRSIFNHCGRSFFGCQMSVNMLKWENWFTGSPIGPFFARARASAHGKKVVTITREPDLSSKIDWIKKQAGMYEKCHSNLEKSGATVCYINKIHGKVLLVDDLIAVVSSFNLLKNPASGLSWEAGIITYEPDVFKSIKDSISKMLDQT